MAKILSGVETLVIVDMQPYFYTSNKPLSQVLSLIKTFKKHGKNILLLEFANCGDSYDEIYDAIGEYEHFDWAEKKFNAGGFELNDILLSHNALCNKFYFCGVNSYFCVKETAQEFARYLTNRKVNYQFYFVEEACWCSTAEQMSGNFRKDFRRNGLDWISKEIKDNRFKIAKLKEAIKKAANEKSFIEKLKANTL
jgi:nicotinamidase-related amidase